MANTEEIGSCIEQIPFEGLEAVGRIFAEGMKKYGRDNWKNDPSIEYRIERCRHAIRHLMLFANGDRGEEHLAKVAWFCLTEIYLNSKLGDTVNSQSVYEQHCQVEFGVHPSVLYCDISDKKTIAYQILLDNTYSEEGAKAP